MSKVVRRLIVLMISVGLVGAFAMTASAGVKKISKPASGSVYAAILGGLKLVDSGKYDAWIDRYCHRATCHNSNVKQAYKKYNLPALSKVSSYCMKDGGIHVTREMDKADGGKKIFLKCKDGGMPRPFHLKKEGGKWLWTNV
jgi:hypothetical protein